MVLCSIFAKQPTSAAFNAAYDGCSLLRFIAGARKIFYNFGRNVGNLDGANRLPVDESKKYIEENCLIIRSFYRRKRGLLKKLNLIYISSSGFLKHYLFQFLFRKEDDWLNFAGYQHRLCSCHTYCLYRFIQVACPSSIAVLYVLEAGLQSGARVSMTESPAPYAI